MAAIWEIVLWSLTALTRGEWPTTGPGGVPLTGWRATKRGRLCGPWTFCLLQIAADLDYLCNYLHLTHFNSADEVCIFCHANRDSLPWTDVRPGSAWMRRLKSGPELHVTCHALFRSSLGVTLAHICVNILHCLDLGTCQDLIGSVVYMLVWDSGISPSP